MYGVYPGALYPGYYGYLVKVPVVPPTSICLTSGVQVRQRVMATTQCRHSLVVSGVEVQSMTAQTEVTTLTVSCEIDVRGKVKYETLECRGFVTSDVLVMHLELPVVPDEPTVESEVSVRSRVISAINCTSLIVGDIWVRSKIQADVEFCCMRTRA